MTHVVPVVRIHERATLDHWVEAFGLRIDLVEPPDGPVVAHAQLCLGDGWIMAGTSNDGAGSQAPGSAASYWVLDDAAAVDALHARAVAAGAASIRVPYDPPYGGRECSLRDREGNVWSFGTYAPGGAG